ncbi:MAG: class I SAM-dependent methyltransferase [Betaproteobacteria bacterium]|nr:class I SAM-dependent methyltransferase [Betaproteobacteria bacterium]
MKRLALALFAWTLFAQAQEPEPRAPFITTPSDVVERMLRLAGTGPADLVVDLGSGDGRIVIDAARKFGARGLGIEIDPKLVELSRENARRANVGDRVSFVQGDVLRVDLSQASVVTVYLLPGLLGRLQPRFLDELRPGTRVVTHAFHMASWKPDRTEKMPVSSPHPGQGDESMIFLWIVPAKARGTWTTAGGAQSWRLAVSQNFQEIELDAFVDGKRLAVTEASLRGSEIAWRAGGRRFRGRIDGARMEGELADDTGASAVVFRREP